MITPVKLSKKEKEPTKELKEEGEAANPTTLLLNFLIELFQHQISFFRTLAQSVVKSFAEDISDQALQFLLDVSFSFFNQHFKDIFILM